MKKLKLELVYRDGTNWKDHFTVDVEIPMNLPLFVGDEIIMGDYGTPKPKDFFESKIHKDEFCDEYDHHEFEVEGIIKLNYIETNFGNIYFKNMTDDNVDEDDDVCTLWDEKGILIGEFNGLYINIHILDKNNIGSMYTKEDYRMQLERIENILKYS